MHKGASDFRPGDLYRTVKLYLQHYLQSMIGSSCVDYGKKVSSGNM